MVTVLGLIAAGCASGGGSLPDSTSAVTVGSEIPDPTTTRHKDATPAVSDAAIGPESSLAGGAVEEPTEVADPNELVADPNELVADPNELVGMRAYTGWGGSNYMGLDGILVIEYPCAYLYPRDNNELLDSREDLQAQGPTTSTAPSGERALLSLVRDWTDYDPETNTLTLREVHYVAETDSYVIGAEGSGEGPIASGDRVELAGIDHLVLGHDDICERDFDIAAERISLCRLHACRMEREAQRQADTSREPHLSPEARRYLESLRRSTVAVFAQEAAQARRANDSASARPSPTTSIPRRAKRACMSTTSRLWAAAALSAVTLVPKMIHSRR